MLHFNYIKKLANGKEVGVYDEKARNGVLDSYIGPFDTIEECNQYCDEYTESWRMGYNGRGHPIILEGKHYAFCSRWTSCD